MTIKSEQFGLYQVSQKKCPIKYVIKEPFSIKDIFLGHPVHLQYISSII